MYTIGNGGCGSWTTAMIGPKLILMLVISVVLGVLLAFAAAYFVIYAFFEAYLG